MVVDPRTVTIRPVMGGARTNYATPSFGDTWQASAGYYLDPIYEGIRNTRRFGLQTEPGFDWRSSIPQGMGEFGSYYANAVNAEHAQEITRGILESLDRRERISRAPFGQQFAAELLNPVNFVGLPLGGPAYAGIRGVAGAALRGGVSAAATEAVLSGAAAAFDPTITSSEVAANTIFTGLFGGALTGGASIPAVRRLGAQQQMADQISIMGRMAAAAERYRNVDFSDLSGVGNREARPFGGRDDVEAINAQYEDRLAILQRQLDQIDPGSSERRIIQDQFDELRAQQQPYTQELYARALEAEGINPNDLYSPTRGGDNWFLNWVSTPMRRAYTSNWGNEVKRTFHLLAGDGGTQLNLHLAGQTDGLSVYQRSATEMGQYANVHLRVLQSWADDTNAPAIGSSRLAGTDLNATSMARRAQNSGDDFTSWITEVNRRRLMGEEMSEAQAAAAAEIDRYFTSWEQRLIETGQIRTRENLGRQINRLEDEINALESELARAEAGERTDRPAAAMEGTLRSRQELLAELQFELDNLPSGQRVEPYNPRYWNTREIRRNRERFAQILREYYEESPYIFTYNERARRWERTRLSTDPDAINARVENTIDTILGERQDVTDISHIYVGSGRGGNIRARQLDIPNSRVWEFIEQNPMITLRNYAARTAPQYHFRRTFGGKTRQQVVDQLRNQMRRDGQSAKEIARATRDFNHMYDRVVGAVLRDPESWDQRVAEVLRFAASTTYLGGAGLAAAADAGRLIMDTDMGVLARAMPAFFDKSLRQTSVRETRLAGAALELLLGSAGQRVVDDQMFNFMNSGRMDRIQSAFHIMNGLGPVTVFTKQFAGMTGAHMIIEASQRVRAGDATAFDRAFLARLGVDEDAAGRIADAPWQADVESGLILPNTDAWTSSAVFRDANGNRINTVEVADGDVGRTVKGQYEPVYIDSNGDLHLDRDYIKSTFEDAPWTRARDVVSESELDTIDPSGFADAPWTRPPYNLAPDAITSEGQWRNFLLMRQRVMDLNESFMNQQRSLLSLSNDEIVANLGEKFRIDRLVTDPEIVERVFASQAESNLLGFHQYSFVSRSREELGTVFLHLGRINDFYERNYKNVDARAELDRINDQLFAGEIDPVAYQHARVALTNIDQFESANDFAEFILFHELHHGPYRREVTQREVGDFEFFDRLTDRDAINDLILDIQDRGYSREQDIIANTLAELGYDWGRLPAATRESIVSDLEVEVADWSEASDLILQRAGDALEYRTSVRDVAESIPEYEARIDELAIDYLRARRQAKAQARDYANSLALSASGGDAMPANAFDSPDSYAGFLGYRAILDADENYSFASLGLNESLISNRVVRNTILNRAALRMYERSVASNADVVQTFRGALNTHINNTIITATPADKPIIMDGVVYVPDHIGARLGLEPDARNPGYSRVENGLLALPFQFYAFALANVNKTVGLMMQGAVRNRLMGVVAMMAMGYMVTAIRTPDYVWDNMSPQDKLARAFDMSGVAALYSDLMYTAMQTTLAMGGPNLTGGILQPRYPQQPNAVDAITNVTGAASGWTADMIMSMMTFAGGDYGEGASQFIRNLPFSNLWFLKNDVNQLGRYLSG